jgi:hypothetical protein
MSIVESMLRELEERTCDLRCRNVPTGGDDYDVEWFVIEHHMAEPKEREIGQGRDAVEAMLVAFHGINNDDLIETMPDPDPMAHST